MKSADIGLIGLGVMGRNLVLNMSDHDFRVAVYNRTAADVDDFLENEASSGDITGAYTLEELVSSLQSPRMIMLMIKAGSPVDATIEALIPLLERGDIIIDGGNSHFEDTARRVALLKEHQLHYIGAGVSGGEIGARFGPSIMPGGDEAAWPHVQPILQAIAARVPDGSPCCEWLGPEGAGHFVKMVHNGIEYGDMQLITEAYDLMKRGLGMSNEEIGSVFEEWNTGVLDSYLIEITADILSYRDENGEAVLDRILDSAGQKGTGRWTAEIALQRGAPLTLIGEAVFARFLSSLKDERIEASRAFDIPLQSYQGKREELVRSIQQALYAAKIVSYAQGYMLMKEISDVRGWNLNFGIIAQLWRAGCIIRAAFLDQIKEAYDLDPALQNLLLSPYFKREMLGAHAAWRRVVAAGAELGIPLPAMSSGLAFFDGYRSDRLPANLLQAQRDYFGAHTYERIDQPRGTFFHTDWTGEGGDITAGSFNA
ncbi:MAG: decarboxylating NADP(+)-dependent phosphogluconate dehydrogenase [Anaerolineales bacterium]|nr:decarboxylating NADP(+)-dependent phosphogluconate dehydrogenase [Anaerolineales bacterium]